MACWTEMTSEPNSRGNRTDHLFLRHQNQMRTRTFIATVSVFIYKWRKYKLFMRSNKNKVLSDCLARNKEIENAGPTICLSFSNLLSRYIISSSCFLKPWLDFTDILSHVSVHQIDHFTPTPPRSRPSAVVYNLHTQ